MDMGKYVAVGVLAVIVLAAVTYEPPKDGGVAATEQPQDGVRVDGVFGGGGSAEAPTITPVTSSVVASPTTSTVPATLAPTAQTTALPASAPRQDEGQRYTIKSGETLCDVAQALLGDRGRWREVYEQNRDKLPDPDHVRAGITLVVKAVQRSSSVTTPPRDTSGQCPTGGRSYTVGRGDTLYSIARRELGNGNRWREIKSLNRLETDTVVVGSTLVLPPR